MTGEVAIPGVVGFLEPFVTCGVFGATEVHAVATFARASGEKSVPVLLAAALAVRAPLLGHVCVELATVAATVVAAIDALPDGVAVESGPGLTPVDPVGSDADGAVVEHQITDLPWPDPATWEEVVAGSNLVAQPNAAPNAVQSGEAADATVDSAGARLKPLVLDGGRLYLSRYWYHERYVAADLVHRTNSTAEPNGNAAFDPMVAAEGHVRRLFDSGPGSGDGDRAGAGAPDGDQLLAALAGLQRDLVVISGGPGTGKTTTVARFLAGLLSGMHEVGSDLQIALAAPTGKAATRMTESIRGAIDALGDSLDPDVVSSLQAVEATTIHRLLGSRGEGGFRHGPDSRLLHDVVIVDEVSMVSLSLMAHLLSAIRPDAKVVLVGDPYQLASVEAGVVLGDIVGLSASTTQLAPGSGTDIPVPPAAIRTGVRTLRTVHRQAAGSPILELAGAIRLGQADEAISLLRSGLDDLVWIRESDEPRRSGSPTKSGSGGLAAIQALVVDFRAVASVKAAVDGDERSASRTHGGTKVLCGLRVGRSGVMAWTRWSRMPFANRASIGWKPFYPGRPVMVTENDYLNNVFNGDVGVAVASDDHFQVWFPAQTKNGSSMPPGWTIATQWAMTIHKSQGSEFAHVVVSLPPPGSRILTRELLYTAVTRAKFASDHHLLRGRDQGCDCTPGDPFDWLGQTVGAGRGQPRKSVRAVIVSANDSIYIHELVDVIGHNRARYQHHMTANWCPIAREERNQLCYGVWSTIGSTGAWPQVVNMWELRGWEGLVANLEHETSGGKDQDPSLAKWWAEAASLRSGGFDRILVPEPWTSSIESLCEAGAGGAVYIHEIVSVTAGLASTFLAELAQVRKDLYAEGAELIGAWRVAGVNDSEVVLLWALESWKIWAGIERAWLDPRGVLAQWRSRCFELGADWRRTALVDSPLSPMRIGRQPEVGDRRPLDQV